uniref:NADH-ubiquinone oxidoreductase chain 3 n=1 Tax=Diartiger fossulatus TaxID=1535458 RepID=A0A0S2M789_9COLE|nr:NADH deshydrogenase subunit 3 [Diartiger fossulatus]
MNSSIIILLVTMLMMFMASLISKKSFFEREKLSPFECGFDPKSFPRMPFSLNFFLIAMIFLVFDVEITLLIPLSMIYNIKLNSLMLISLILFTILLLGLYLEWFQGSLNWLF